MGEPPEGNIGVHLLSQFDDESSYEGEKMVHLDEQAIAALYVQIKFLKTKML
jgi:hypothetical protein